MTDPKREQMASEPRQTGGRASLWLALIAVAAAAAIVVSILASKGPPGSQSSAPASATSLPGLTPATETKPLAELVTMDVAKAVMVTVELDFGGKPPTIAEALQQIERRYQPDDGAGRTFAILDAYGEPTPDGKLHMSMHVSSEKPGMASLVFKRTGQILWRARIMPTTQIIPEKRLTILVGDAAGKSYTVDGSTNPGSILEASLKEPGLPVKSVWKDGEDREVTFIYSACGCPVKAMVKRAGDRTVRTKDTPVIFPDDPAAVALISRLMRW